MNAPRLALLLAVLGLLAPGSATAQITFDQAIALASQSPAVRAAGDALAARRAGDEHLGGTLGPLQAVVMPGGRLAPDGDQGLEVQASLVQSWTLGPLARSRRDAAREERGELAAQERARALAANLEAGRQWILLRTLEEVSAELDERVAVTDELVARLARGVELGVIAAADLADARALLAEVRQEQLAAEGARFEASTALQLAMGQPPDPAGLHTAGPAPAPVLPTRDDLATRLESLDGLPSVESARRAEAAARQRGAEQAAASAPSLQLGGQLEHSGPAGWTLFGLVGLQLPAPGQGRRARSLADAEVAASAAARESVEQSARGELAVAIHELDHSREVLAQVREALLPAAEEARALRDRAVALGEGTVLALLDAQRRELAARIDAAHARGDALWAELRLWLLLSTLDPSEVS